MSVFSDLKPTNHAVRNGFDLSRRSVFSVKNGQILPVFVQHTLPNSDYRIDVNQLLRTQPLQKAAFTGFSINYDFAFVPFNQLYSSFNQFIGQRSDAFLAKQPSFENIPLFPLLQFIIGDRGNILYDFIVSDFSDDYYEFFKRQEGSETPFPVRYRLLQSNYSDQSVWVDFIRALDMYGYFNLLPFFKKAKENYFSIVGDSVYNWETFFQYYRDPLAEGTALERLSADIASSFTSSLLGDDVPLNLSDSTTLYNIFAPMAYTKMFYEFYRNKYYDLQVVLDYGTHNAHNHASYPFNYNELFNYDDYVRNTSGSYDRRTILRIVSTFAIHYHAYRKDLFTGILPSMQFGNVSMQLANAVADGVQSRYIMDARLASGGTISDVLVDSNGRFFSDSLQGASTTGSRVNFALSPNIAISVLESRRADAMQRFRERMMRAGDSTRDIFKAHGWESPKSEQFHEPIFLGSFDGRLDINTVAATSSNEDTELGQLGANGIGVVQGSEIKFHSSDFGVIIGVMYIVKDSEYNSFGTDRQYCLSEPFDFPYPELQNISLSPVVYRQLQGLNLQNRYSARSPYPYGLVYKDLNSILGYLPAFMEYKTAVDKVHGEFCSGEYLLATQAFGTGTYYGRSLVFSGVFSDWVTPRQSILAPDSLKFLYQQPDIVDNVFLQAQTDNQDTDPFLVNCYFKCLAIEPLTVIGLPV